MTDLARDIPVPGLDASHLLGLAQHKHKHTTITQSRDTYPARPAGGLSLKCGLELEPQSQSGLLCWTRGGPSGMGVFVTWVMFMAVIMMSLPKIYAELRLRSASIVRPCRAGLRARHHQVFGAMFGSRVRGSFSFVLD